MERLFQNSKIAEIIPYDTESQVLFFPVRHHSPVCSYHLIQTIRNYSPEIILIEGPENANDLIPVLSDDETVLPASFYCFYKDSKKFISEQAEDYRCYYPFLYSSPEYNAIVQAKKMDIPSRFIDLPYYEILINTSQQKGLLKKADKHSYADDSKLVNSVFYKKLCEKTGTRDFDEFWEKYFEIGGIYLTSKKFAQQMHTYCIMTRIETPDEELEQDGTNAREKYMASNILECMQTYKKILVVTGGFHSYGLFNLINSGKFKKPKVHKISSDNQGCYPMAYSYESADALNGYASGMKYPFFYDCISKDLLSDCENVYNYHTLDFLTRTAKKTAEKDIPVSIADVTSAHSLMNGLSAMRNIRECGIYELFDGITSCFIKGEKNISSSVPLEILAKLASGDGIGRIGDKNHTPPLIADFEKQCEKFKLKYQSAVQTDIDVSLFASQRGKDISRFMHRMEFLETGFAKMMKGPDLHRNKDKSRVHEEWRYKRTPQTDSALIDHTTEGFTIEEACRTYASKKINQERRCETSAHIAVDCFLMGIEMQEQERKKLDEILRTDGDFFSLGNGMHSFEILYRLQSLYDFSDISAFEYILRCFEKLIALVPSMANVSSDRAEEFISIIRIMYGITGDILHDKREDFRQALITVSEAPEKEPSVYGAVMGMLYAMDSSKRTDAENAMKGYLKGSAEIKKKGAEYLKGLFSTARDIVLIDNEFIKMTDELITGMDYNDFMEILPSMKLAFSYFTPSEIQETAESVAVMHNSDKDDLLKVRAVDEKFFLFGEALDREICDIMGKGKWLE